MSGIDPDHPIVDEPWRYEIGAVHYHVGLDGGESYLDLDLHLDEDVCRLRFWSPQQLQIEEGFPRPTHGMAILDVRARQLDGLAVWVTDFEGSRGQISFWARDVVDRDEFDERCADKFPCAHVAYHATMTCDVHESAWECPDATLVRAGAGFGIPIRDGGESVIRIEYCPWCGVRLDRSGTVGRAPGGEVRR